MDKDNVIQSLIQKVEELTLRVQHLETLGEENEILRQENKELRAENAELKSQLNSNSNNSSRPPSSDGYQKKPAFQKEKGGKQGGQPGHKGRTLNQVENPGTTITCQPGSCRCGHIFSERETVLVEKRQVFDLPEPRLEVTEYQIHKAVCPVCGLLHKGIAPEGVKCPCAVWH